MNNTSLANKANTTSFNIFTGSTFPNQLSSGTTTPFILDNQASTANVFAYKTNVDIKGQGQIIMTNGSGNISGISTNFLSATTGRGLSYWFGLWVKDSSNRWYYVNLTTIPSNTTATTSKILSRSIIRAGGFNNNGNTSSSAFANAPSTFTGATGTYDYWIVKNWSDGLYSVAMGNNAYADNFSIALGGQATALGTSSIAMGQKSFASGANAMALGIETKATNTQSMVLGYRSEATGTFAIALGLAAIASGNGAAALGRGFDAAGSASDRPLLSAGLGSVIVSSNDINQTSGHGALADYCGIFGGVNHNMPSNSLRSAIVGGNAIKASSAVTDTVFMPKIRIGQGTGGAITNNSASQWNVVMNQTTGELETVPFSGLTTDIKIGTVGKGLYVKEGTNATSGIKTLTGGTAVVSTTKVTSSSRIQLTSQADGGTPGFLRVSTRSAGTSFTITSSSGTDISQVAWFIVEPA